MALENSEWIELKHITFGSRSKYQAEDILNESKPDWLFVDYPLPLDVNHPKQPEVGDYYKYNPMLPCNMWDFPYETWANHYFIKENKKAPRVIMRTHGLIRKDGRKGTFFHRTWGPEDTAAKVIKDRLILEKMAALENKIRWKEMSIAEFEENAERLAEGWSLTVVEKGEAKGSTSEGMVFVNGYGVEPAKLYEEIKKQLRIALWREIAEKQKDEEKMRQ